MMPICSIASHADADDITALVNRAYRPAAAMGGWTHEADWVRGPRTTNAQVKALMNGSSVVLALRDAGTVIACVHVAFNDATATIGMLATDPALQGMGLGTQMLEHAERHAIASDATGTLLIDVLDRRSELVSFYERRGYKRTGVVQAYPLAGGFGSPVVEGLQVLQMAKTVVPCPQQQSTRKPRDDRVRTRSS